MGNFIGGPGEVNKIKSKYLSKGLEVLDYDALNLAQKDLSFGADFLVSVQREFRLPLISANIKYRKNNQYFVEPFIIKKINNLKVGIFGLTQKNNRLEPRNIENLVFASAPNEAARKMVTELVPKCDLIIALSHLGFGNNRNLAKQVPEIDVIISGGSYSVVTDPVRVGATLIVQGKNKGQSLNLLVLQHNVKQQQLVSFHGRSGLLDQRYKKAPDILQIISEYKNAYRQYLRKKVNKQN